MRRSRLFGGTDGDALDALQYELVQEKAANLARLGRRLEDALGALRAHDAGVRPDPERRAALVDTAGEALWYYVVQREVCGFRDGDAVIRELRVPREVMLRMGPPAARGRRHEP